MIRNTVMSLPLTLAPILERAGKLYSNVEVLSRLPSRRIVRSTWGEVYKRSHAFASALAASGLKRGDRVATLAWNHSWHLEAYFGIPAAGGVLHTLNVRLHPDELAYIANHSEDRVLVVDDVLLPLYEKFRAKTHFERVLVVASTEKPVPAGYEDYEDFLKLAVSDYEFPQMNEDEAAALSFTSGTTGLPKGVVSSHRSIVLHSLCAALPENHSLQQRDCVLPAVAMFHVNAWGIPYAAAMTGAKLVLPGQYLDAPGLLDLMEQEQVNRSAGVPTVWMGVLDLLEKDPGKWKLHPDLRIMGGGAAVPREMMRAFAKHGINLKHAWGMTETGPLASMSELKNYMWKWPEEERLDVRATQGLPLPMLDARIVNDVGVAPWDGKTLGELQVRGSWVASEYYNLPDQQELKWTSDGWFRTGDVGSIDPEGYIRIADRSKDLIKSGGEWISSVDLENNLMEHPAVREAAVIAVPHPRWQERPLAAVVLRENAQATAEDLRTHLARTFLRWQLPDAIVFLREIPRTSVGKFQKSQLREMFANWSWENENVEKEQ